MAGTKQKHRRTGKGLQLPQRGLAGRVALVEQPLVRQDLPEFVAGDTVKVHVRILEGDKERIQIYEGAVIARSGKGSGRSFTVRKISHGVGVERIFLESSPKISRMEVVQKGKVRRAKLYYLRGLEGKAARIKRIINPAGSAKAVAAAQVKAKAKAEVQAAKKAKAAAKAQSAE